MALVLALQSVQLSGDGGRKQIKRVYDVTFTGSYAGSGAVGDPIDFTSTVICTNPNKLERARPGNNPIDYTVRNMPPGYQIVITPGSALATGWGLRIFQQKDPAAAGGADIPFTELANGAYPAALTGITAGVRIAFYSASK